MTILWKSQSSRRCLPQAGAWESGGKQPEALNTQTNLQTKTAFVLQGKKGPIQLTGPRPCFSKADSGSAHSGLGLSFKPPVTRLQHAVSSVVRA